MQKAVQRVSEQWLPVQQVQALPVLRQSAPEQRQPVLAKRAQ